MQTNSHSVESGAALSPAVPSEASRLLARARNAAYAEVAQGRLGQGLTLLHEALQDEPSSHDLLSDMAALLLAAGEMAHAERFARRALELRADHGPSLYTLGFALSGQQDHAQAMAVLTALMTGDAMASLQAEAPDLLPVAREELLRLHILSVRHPTN